MQDSTFLQGLDNNDSAAWEELYTQHLDTWVRQRINQKLQKSVLGQSFTADDIISSIVDKIMISDHQRAIEKKTTLRQILNTHITQRLADAARQQSNHVPTCALSEIYDTTAGKATTVSTPAQIPNHYHHLLNDLPLWPNSNHALAVWIAESLHIIRLLRKENISTVVGHDLLAAIFPLSDSLMFSRIGNCSGADCVRLRQELLAREETMSAQIFIDAVHVKRATFDQWSKRGRSYYLRTSIDAAQCFPHWHKKVDTPKHEQLPTHTSIHIPEAT